MTPEAEALLTTFIPAGILAFLGVAIFFIIIIIAIFYIYFSLCWMTIAKKLKFDKPWLAWIPFANTAMQFHLGELPWALIFLILIPVVGWIAIFILTIIANWKVFEKRNYPGWLSLAAVLNFIPAVNAVAGIAQIIIIGLVAFSDRK